jgi:hypothetical protein
MPNDLEVDPAEGYAAALAAFSLSVNTLRFLQKKGALDQQDVTLIVSEVLSSLGQSELVATPVVHKARELLSGVAADMGVRLAKPS